MINIEEKGSVTLLTAGTEVYSYLGEGGHTVQVSSPSHMTLGPVTRPSNHSVTPPN